METLTLTISAANNAADELENLKMNFDQEVDNMESVYRTLSNMWEGEAKDKFTEQLRIDEEKFTKFSALVASYVKTLREDVALYKATEQNNYDIAATRTS